MMLSLGSWGSALGPGLGGSGPGRHDAPRGRPPWKVQSGRVSAAVGLGSLGRGPRSGQRWCRRQVEWEPREQQPGREGAAGTGLSRCLWVPARGVVRVQAGRDGAEGRDGDRATGTWAGRLAQGPRAPGDSPQSPDRPCCPLRTHPVSTREFFREWGLVGAIRLWGDSPRLSEVVWGEGTRGGTPAWPGGLGQVCLPLWP